jgi:hypothetical protein
MKAHDIGERYYWQRLFWHTDDPPLVHRTTTQEIEHPYRYGTCVVVRMPLTKVALAVGKWRGEKREAEALLSAMQGRVHKTNDADESLAMEDWDV